MQVVIIRVGELARRAVELDFPERPERDRARRQIVLEVNGLGRGRHGRGGGPENRVERPSHGGCRKQHAYEEFGHEGVSR